MRKNQETFSFSMFNRNSPTLNHSTVFGDWLNSTIIALYVCVCMCECEHASACVHVQVLAFLKIAATDSDEYSKCLTHHPCKSLK